MPKPRIRGAFAISRLIPRQTHEQYSARCGSFDESTASPRPVLSVFDGAMIVVGIVIGAGIFRTPSMVAGVTGSVEWMLTAWLLGGVLTLIGALCYAELASTFPNAGGDYHFLTRAYGRDISFFFAWARVAVITTGSIALLAFVFGDYMSRVVSLGPNSSAIYAAITVIVLTALNVIGLRESSRTQNILTILEVTGLLLVTLAGSWQPRPSPHRPHLQRAPACLRCSDWPWCSYC